MTGCGRLLLLPVVLLAGCRPLAMPDGSASRAPDAPAPPPGRELARFGDARALAATSSGLLAVADAADGRVRLLRLDGTALGALGGAGGALEALLEPAAVDPTNGLDFFVADAGNERVLRYTAEGALAETIRLAFPGEGARPGAALPGPPSEGNALAGPSARPVGVAAGAGGVLFVADAARRAVLRLDRARRLDAVLGGPDAGAAALARPVALTLASDGALFVADAGRGVVQRFDALGRPDGAWPVPGDPSGLRGVALDHERGRLVVATAAALWALDARDPDAPPVRLRLREARPADEGAPPVARPEPFVAAVVVGGRLLFLTPMRLVDAGPAGEGAR